MHLYGCNIEILEFFVDKVGIIKEIDALGRLQIPKEIRKRLGFEKNVELVVTEEGLLIRSDRYKLVETKKTDSSEY